MANWCYNLLTLSGRYKNFAKQLYKHDYNNDAYMGEGAELKISHNKSEWIFGVEKHDENIYSFESKWIPPIEALAERARKGGFSFELEFEETGNLLYGKAIFSDGVLRTYYVPEDTMMRYSYDEDGNAMIDDVQTDITEQEFYDDELSKVIGNYE